MVGVGLKRRIKQLGKRSLHKLFLVGQRCGVDILPRHFYSNIPDIRELQRTRHWRAASQMPDVHGTDLDAQLAFAQEVCGPYHAELQGMNVYERGVAEAREIGFGPTEGEFLTCFIRSQRPARVVQIGCGASTAMILLAAKDQGHPVQVTCVEPFPSSYLKEMDRAGIIKLVAEPAQVVDLSLFGTLEAGDLLFVDSTHTVKAGSEVNRIILEILPRLRAGVHVHFHDISFPYGHTRNILESTFFWEESVLLHAFLIGNARCAISASLSMLHYGKPQELSALLPHYRPRANDGGLDDPSRPQGHFPSSTYLRTG